MEAGADWAKPPAATDKGTEVYRSLRERLLAYSFPPFLQLNIRDQAASLGVSSTPVREALVRLADEEIIEFRPGRGFFTKPLTLGSVYEDFEMEMVLLRYAIQKSASNFSASKINLPTRLGSGALTEEAFIDRVNEYASFLGRFHSELALSTNNNKISTAMSLCCDRLHYVRIVDLTDRARLFAVAGNISTLIDCLMSRNIEGVISLVQLNFEASVRQIERIVKNGNAISMNRSAMTGGSVGV